MSIISLEGGGGGGGLTAGGGDRIVLGGGWEATPSGGGGERPSSIYPEIAWLAREAAVDWVSNSRHCSVDDGQKVKRTQVGVRLQASQHASMVGATVLFRRSRKGPEYLQRDFVFGHLYILPLPGRSVRLLH